MQVYDGDDLMSLVMREIELDSSSLYLQEVLSQLSPWEEQSRSAAESLDLARISLSRAEAHLLRWTVRQAKAKKAVEIGTLTGLSGLYILDGLDHQGSLWTFEKEQKHADLAKPILENFAKNKNKTVNIKIGDARIELPKINNEGPFDFVFIDGNKAAYLDYLDWAESHTHPGSIVVADNVLLGGTLLNDEVQTEGVNFSKKQREVMRNFNSKLLNSKVWRAVLVPTQEGLMIAEKI